MRFAGVIPEDARDPRVESAARAHALPFPIVGFVPQPSITDTGMFAFQGWGELPGTGSIAVSRSYTVWRNPDDHTDPVNLAELDEPTRASLDTEPPWPRPAWMIEMVQLMRYRMLWEAVRTSFTSDASEHTTLSRQLVDHANHVLRNRYREQLGWRPGQRASGASWMITPSAVRGRATARLDGVEVDAVEIDTDPFVHAIGFDLEEGVVVTVVVARDELNHLDRSLTTIDADFS